MFRSGFVSFATAALTLLPLMSSAQDCSTYSYTPNNQQTGADHYQHNNGAHSSVFNAAGACNYTDQSGTNNCSIQCTVAVTPAMFEDGTTTPYQHVTNYATTRGSSNSNGPSTSCGGQMAGAVRSCLSIMPTCDITVSISGSSHGIGGSISYSATTIWNPTYNYNLTCAPEQYVPPVCNPVGSPDGVPEDGYTWEWDYTTCQWVQVPLGPSPIVIDTNGEGFHMTSVAEGVKFDFYGDGHPIQISWTAKGSQNGWLALPDKDGQITSARNLFGNITAQYLTKNHPPNGFAALAVYDNPGLGGNANGKIDPGDAIWGRLRVWIDTNHDGISQPDELYTLDSLGIGHIDLRYLPSDEVDEYGNKFRFKGDLAAVRADDDVDRKIFDVFLITK